MLILCDGLFLIQVKPDPEQPSHKHKKSLSYIDMAKVSFLRHRLLKIGMAL